MKRTNLVLDRGLLEEATRVTRARTYSEAVNEALKEIVRVARAGRVFEFAGSGAWRGDLGEMRGDRPRRSARR